MKTHLFVYPGWPISPAPFAQTTTSELPRDPRRAAEAIAAVLRDDAIEILVFWDPALGAAPGNEIGRFARSLDDAWHPGPRLSGPDGSDPLCHVQPLWVYRLDPPADVGGAINWKLDPRATLIRASVVRSIGGLDPRFETLAGAFRDLGLRLIRRGAVCRQQPELVVAPVDGDGQVSLADRYRLVRHHYSNKWAAYSFVRRLAEVAHVGAEWAAWNSSAANAGHATSALPAALMRDVDSVQLPSRPSVTVILPTFGRYRYVAEVLDDLRAQTISPTQILIADGNPSGHREPEVYERYPDLPIEVVWHEQSGICSGRNALLARATGELIWFVDDDSRFEPNNLESHLRVLAAYGADVSVGPAYTRSRPELHGDQLEVACTFMDCGTTLCRRTLLEAVGGFDMQFNEWLAGEDGELGIRFVRAGGLMVNNPLAKRFHYVAPVGGSRTSKRSVHRFTRWSLMPRPVQSIYYTARRYFEPPAATDAMLMAAVLYGWRRREGVPATRGWKLRTLVGELIAVPITALRLRRSIQLGREMVAQGPRIASLSAR